jgi:hypothetical protein
MDNERHGLLCFWEARLLGRVGGGLERKKRLFFAAELDEYD